MLWGLGILVFVVTTGLIYLVQLGKARNRYLCLSDWHRAYALSHKADTLRMYGDRRQVIEAIGIADEALAYLGASEPYANELVGKAAYKNRHEWILAVKDKAMRREEQLRS